LNCNTKGAREFTLARLPRKDNASQHANVTRLARIVLSTADLGSLATVFRFLMVGRRSPSYKERAFGIF
jgi:hypothetical protein